MVVRYSVRSARPDDAEAVSVIYNEGIADRATLETEPRTPAERRSWLAARDARYPVVVVESDGVVVGWASLNVFNVRDAYRHVADISVYVARASRGKGAGTMLLQRLVELGRELGFHKLVLAGFPTNAASVALYGRLGFREVPRSHALCHHSSVSRPRLRTRSDRQVLTLATSRANKLAASARNAPTP